MRLNPKDLYLVQTTALTNSNGKSGFAFFMEMGLGKTRTVIYEFDEYADEGMVDFLLVIAPRPLRTSWSGEMEELGNPYPTLLFGKNKDAEKFVKETKEPCMIVIHYELVLTRGGDFIEWLLEQGRVYIALDESTRIKNKDSKVAKRLKKIHKETPFTFRRVLSGSPAPQGPHDLWSQFDFIGATKRPYFGFRNMYCRMGGWMGKQVIGSQNLDGLRNETGDWVFRAKKKEWTDLPEKLPPVIYEAEMLPNQRQAYMEMMHDFVTMWGDDPITVQMAVTAKAKLAQITSGFIYDEEGETHWIVRHDQNPKLGVLEMWADQIEGKGIIFYHHKPTLEALTWWAMRHHEEWDFAVLKGKMKDEEIAAEKARFNNEDRCRFIFCQSSSHKFGHTLLGTEKEPCFNSMFFENTYSHETRVQSEDRNHRHGQKHPVAYGDIAVSREDKKIIQALVRKENFHEALMSEFGR